jgi:hypothetical protein
VGLTIAGRLVGDPLPVWREYARKYPATVRGYGQPGPGDPGRLAPEEAWRSRIIGSRVTLAERDALVKRAGEPGCPWDAVPAGADLADASPAVPDGLFARAAELYWHFTCPRIDGVRAAKVHKVLHVKRPALYPILDSKVRGLYEDQARPWITRLGHLGVKTGDSPPYWAAIREDLRCNGAGIDACRDELARDSDPAVAMLAVLSTLRLQDILAWYLATGGTETRNPWRGLDSSTPYVTADDEPYVMAWNDSLPEGKDSPFFLDLGLPPEPFLGSHDAPVVVLSANPGHAPDDAAAYQRIGASGRLAEIAGEGGAPLRWVADDVRGTPGGKWWRKTLGALNKAGYGFDELARCVLDVEFHGYHSARWHAFPVTLPSQRFGFGLVEQAITRDAVIVLTRAEREWKVAVPGLAGHGRLIRAKSWQTSSLSPGNLGPEGFRLVTDAIEQHRARKRQGQGKFPLPFQGVRESHECYRRWHYSTGPHGAYP